MDTIPEVGARIARAITLPVVAVADIVWLKTRFVLARVGLAAFPAGA